MTDEQGNFRIDFKGATFRQTPVKGVNVEGKGPDLYFRIEGPDGSLIVAEDRSRSSEPDRRDVDNLYSTDLLIDL